MRGRGGGARLKRVRTRGDTSWQSHRRGTRAARATGETAGDAGCGRRPGSCGVFGLWHSSRSSAGATATGPPARDKASRFARATGPPAGKPGCGAAGRVPLSPGSVTAHPARSLSAAPASLTWSLRCAPVWGSEPLWSCWFPGENSVCVLMY